MATKPGERRLQILQVLAEMLQDPKGEKVTLTIQRPGEAPHDVTLTRRQVTGALPDPMIA